MSCPSIRPTHARACARLITAAIVAVTPFTAEAQTVFADMAWGSSPTQVGAKLSAQGYSGCGYVTKLFCSVFSTCSCKFSGPGVSQGTAFFVNRRLDQVHIFLEYSMTGQVTSELHRKYGEPRHLNSNRTGMLRHLAPILWESPNGDSVTLDRQWLRYQSAANNKRNRDYDERLRSRF